MIIYNITTSQHHNRRMNKRNNILINNPLYADFCIRTTDLIIIPCHRVFFHDIPIFKALFTIYDGSPGCKSVLIPGTTHKVQLISVNTTKKMFLIILDLLYISRVKDSYLTDFCSFEELFELYEVLKGYFKGSLNSNSSKEYSLIRCVRIAMRRISKSINDPILISKIEKERQIKWNIEIDDRLFEEIPIFNDN